MIFSHRLKYATLTLGLLVTLHLPTNAATETTTMVILPFKNISANPSDNWLKESFSENLTMGLGQVDSLKLIERTEITKLLREQSFAQTALADSKKAPRLGRMVGANYVILGNYQKLGEEILVNVKVVNVETGAIESKSLTQIQGKFKNLFQLQTRLTQSLVKKLNVTHTPQDKKEIQAVLKSTQSTEAHEYYIKAKILRDRLGDKNLKKAITLLQLAVQEDPNYALAYAELAGTYLDRYAGGDFYQSAEKSDLQKAQKWAGKAIKLAPNQADGYSIYAKVLSSKNKKSEALEMAKKALDIEKSTRSILAYITLKHPLTFYMTGGKGAFFEKELKDLGADMEDPKILFTLGAMYFSDIINNPKADISRAFTLYEKAHQKNPHNPFMTLTLASAYLVKGQYNEAKTLLKQIIKENPDNTVLLFYGAQTIQGIAPDTAIEWTQKLISLQPDYALAYFQMAKFYLLRKKDKATAELWFKKGELLIGGSAESAYSAGNYLMARESPERAEHFLKQALRIWKEQGAQGNTNYIVQYYMGLTSLARAYYAQKKYNPALQAYKKVINSSYTTGFVKGFTYKKMAQIYVKQNNPEAAFKIFEEFVKLFPKQAQSKENKQLYQGYFTQNALKKDPENPQLLNDMGQSYLAIKEYGQAQNYLLKAKKLAPKNAVVHYNLGLLYLKQKKPTLAIEAFQEAIILNPDYVKAYYNLGLIYYENNQTEAARKMWTSCVQRDPHFAPAKSALAQISNAQNN